MNNTFQKKIEMKVSVTRTNICMSIFTYNHNNRCPNIYFIKLMLYRTYKLANLFSHLITYE